MSNYTVTTTYQTLSDILGADYDATKDYHIHVNEIAMGLLQISDNNTSMGKQYPSFSDFVVDKGATVYLKGTNIEVNIFAEGKV